MTSCILIVDDNDVFRDTLERACVLLFPEVRLLAVDCGEKAIVMTASHRVDVAVVDIRMPGMDGLETLRRIKETSPATKVIVVSMNDQCSYRSRALKTGADAFVSKCRPSQELTLLVKGFLEASTADGG